jgi:nickel transport protein
LCHNDTGRARARGRSLQLLGGGIGFATVVAICLILSLSPAAAFDLFGPRHEVTVQFATPDGKPMAQAEVRVFAPGEPSTPSVTGRTDSDGKFVFTADRDGFWNAEARGAGQIAHLMVRVGGDAQPESWFSPLFLIGLLAILTAVAIWYRLLRAQTRRPRPPGPVNRG